MKLLFIGDVMGRSGREAALKYVPEFRKKYALDFVVINGENAAGGRGITPVIARELYEAGADAITLGNHGFGQKEIVAHIDQDKKMVRPLNYPQGTPGRGATVLETVTGKKVLVINALGCVFMDPLNDPFRAVEEILAKHPLGRGVDFALVDFHAEASSEKNAMGHFFDGRVSVVVGTHTHIPTSDARVLPKGTGFMTDAGMTGDYDSVIGVKADIAQERFTKKVNIRRMEPADGEATLCGVLVKSDDKTGLTQEIEPLIIGPHLRNQMPETF